jgi:polyisoprenoid-binding protein YceI
MIVYVRRLRALAALLAVAAGGARLEAQPRTYVVDPAGSRVRIQLDRAGLMKFMGHAHQIAAPVADGRVEVVDDDAARSTVALRFESARLVVVPGSEPADNIPTVEGRMRGPELLDVARYPEIAFVSRSVRSVATEGDHVRVVVNGSLTLRGRSFPVEVPLEVTRIAGGGLQARGETDLNLRDLGIEPPSIAGVVKVANRFRLEFDIRASANAAPGSTAHKPGTSIRGPGSMEH